MPRLLERKLNALSAKRMTKPGRHADGSGLYLHIAETGSKSWILRVTVKGKARTIGLGSTLDVTLAEAREKATQLRKVAKAGGDPIAERDGKDHHHVPTFREAAHQVHAEHCKAWKNGQHRSQWINTLRDFAFPVIGDMRVNVIGSNDILTVLQPIWLTKIVTAKRVKQRMKSILDWCIAKHYRETVNPVDAVWMALPKQPKKKIHHAALPYEDVTAFLSDLRACRSNAVVKIGFELLIHTACRSGEVLGARWDEVDIEKALWTIPAERIKSGVEHRVPLSNHCIELLDLAKLFKSNSPYIFPGRGWKRPICITSFADTLRSMKRNEITVHGFRSSFRDWAAERTSASGDVCEASLAHQVRNKVEAAYRRTDLLDLRRPLMEEWSQFLTTGLVEEIRLRT